MATVLLFLILAVPGQKSPVPYQKEMASLEECVIEAADILAKAKDQLKAPGAIQVGCIYSPPASVDN